MHLFRSSPRPCIFFRALLLLLASTTVYSQTAKSGFAAVPANQRATLAQRLRAYTEAFRKEDWVRLTILCLIKIGSLSTNGR